MTDHASPGRFTRRGVLVGAGALAAASGLAQPGWASGAAGRKLVLIILRGALDGLAAVPPYADPNLLRLRATVTPPAPGQADGAFALAEGFGLHPALSFIHGRFAAGEAAFAPAVATPYRERSHFDGQDVLENGVDQVFGADDGWLNRALSAAASGRRAVAVGRTTPLVLRGAAEATSWSPPVLPSADEDTLDRLAALYAEAPLLRDALAQARALDEATGAMDMTAGARRGAGPRYAREYTEAATAAARLMTSDAHADLAVLSFDGWDTHQNQAPALNGRLAALDAALAALHEGLGAAWSSTVVLVVSEFGRTVRVNGTDGTDHGSGGLAMALGGAVAGGRMIGDWPGLTRLHEGRDLIPATDLRALFKGVLRDHWGLERAALDTAVFPGSSGVAPLDGLIA